MSILLTSYCAVHRKDSLCACQQGDMHMLLWLAVEMRWLALGGPMLALVTQMHHSHLIGVPFLAVKAIRILTGFCWLRMLTSLLMSGSRVCSL